MKTFALTRLSLATAMALACATSFAQVPTNPFSLPKVPTIPTVPAVPSTPSVPNLPSLPASSLDIAAMAGQQAQMVSDLITKLHEQATKATSAVLGASAETMNPDELEAALAERIPGFAGWIHREDGSTVMRLAGIKASDAATILARMPSAASLAAATGSKVTVQAAMFDSRQLLDFKTKAFSAASVKGVVAAWINRETNRVEIKYNSDLDQAAIEALTNRLVSTGIPRAAMVLSPGEIAKTKSATGVSLQSQMLPLAAGSQIILTVGNDLNSCTLGVPVIRGGVRGFVTAAHCSHDAFGSERVSLYADSTNVTYIGDETADPKGTACPSGLADATRGCRKSDSLFVATRVPNAVDFGKLLITGGAGKLTATKILDIKGAQNNPTVNQKVYKTGRTTGTTHAKVARVCVDTLVTDLTGNTYGLQCASEVDAAGFAAPGDSGSPIWLSSNGAIITGILSYGRNDAATIGFSPWGAVVKDLGSLTIK